MTMTLFVALLAAATGGVSDPVETQAEAAFPGWTMERKAAGDLNGDSRVDVVVTLRREGKETAQGMLAVFLCEADGKLRLHTRAPKAVCVGCGGPKAPFDEVLGEPSITPKGILSVAYEGGSREMWTWTFKWRYDASVDRFLLIGETQAVVDTLSDDGELDPGQVSFEDINYLSGKMRRTISQRGTQTCDVKRTLNTTQLGTFNFEKYAWDTEKAVKGSCKKK
jgi:hypothetical protein